MRQGLSLARFQGPAFLGLSSSFCSLGPLLLCGFCLCLCLSPLLLQELGQQRAGRFNFPGSRKGCCEPDLGLCAHKSAPGRGGEVDFLGPFLSPEPSPLPPPHYTVPGRVRPSERLWQSFWRSNLKREQQHDVVSLAEEKSLNIHALFREERVFWGDALEAAGLVFREGGGGTKP